MIKGINLFYPLLFRQGEKGKFQTHVSDPDLSNDADDESDSDDVQGKHNNNRSTCTCWNIHVDEHVYIMYNSIKRFSSRNFARRRRQHRTGRLGSG